MKELGTFGSATSINAAGQVVGFSGPNDEDGYAFLYSNGAMVDLNALLDPASGWTLISRQGHQRFRTVVGSGRAPDGNIRAFLLTPCSRHTPCAVGAAHVPTNGTRRCACYNSRRDACATTTSSIPTTERDERMNGP